MVQSQGKVRDFGKGDSVSSSDSDLMFQRCQGFDCFSNR